MSEPSSVSAGTDKVVPGKAVFAEAAGIVPVFVLAPAFVLDFGFALDLAFVPGFGEDIDTEMGIAFGFGAGIENLDGIAVGIEADSFQSLDCTWAFPNLVLDMDLVGNMDHFQDSTWVDKHPSVGYTASDMESSDSFGS